jgi:outer membrane lipoprotein-sorting protein
MFLGDKMKRVLLLLIVVFLIVSFSGCTETQPEQKTKENGTIVSGEDIKEILTKAENTKNFEYDFEGTLIDFRGEFTSTAKVYALGEKSRMEFEEEGKKKAIVDNGDYEYIYDYETDSWSRDFYPMIRYDLHDISKKALEDSGLKELGTEKVDGLNTRIIEFTYKDEFDATADEKIKAWISEDYGIALKMEIRNIETDKLKIKSEMSNFKVNTVKESMVTVPEEAITGVKEVCEETEEPYSEETIEEILAKAKEPKNMEYNIAKRTIYSETSSLVYPLVKVYQKDNKYRAEKYTELVDTAFISNGETVYQHYYDKDTELYELYGDFYRELDEGQIEFSEKPIDFTGIADQILNDAESKETGKERICGRNTRIVEFQYKHYYPLSKSWGEYKAKAWITEKEGVTVKLEYDNEGAITKTELKAIEFDSVEESLFVIPEEKIRTADEIWTN